jgi:hypothetical protein
LTNDKEVSELTEANFSNVIFEFFTTTLSDGTVVDLKPNGANIPVTYVSLSFSPSVDLSLSLYLSFFYLLSRRVILASNRLLV